MVPKCRPCPHIKLPWPIIPPSSLPLSGFQNSSKEAQDYIPGQVENWGDSSVLETQLRLEGGFWKLQLHWKHPQVLPNLMLSTSGDGSHHPKDGVFKVASGKRWLPKEGRLASLLNECTLKRDLIQEEATGQNGSKAMTAPKD